MSDHLGQAGKAEVLREYFDTFNPQTVIETGVWEGWGSCFQFHDRANVIGIEANDESSERARQNGYNVITGDSATVLPKLIRTLDNRAMFWLDAHTVEWIDGHGSCPLLTEIETIKQWRYGADSIVLIDDVRMMSEPGWPGLESVLASCGDTWKIENRDDILRLTPW